MKTLFIRTIICVLKNTDNLDQTLKSVPCNANYTYCISQWRVLHFWSLKMSCLMWKFLLYLLWNVFIQDFQWNYAVPYSVTLKDWANCAEVTCINMHRYRCKMPVFLIWLPPILDFRRSVGPYPDRRNQRGLNMSFFSAYYLLQFLCVTCNIMYFILTGTLHAESLPCHPYLQSLYHSIA